MNDPKRNISLPAHTSVIGFINGTLTRSQIEEENAHLGDHFGLSTLWELIESAQRLLNNEKKDLLADVRGDLDRTDLENAATALLAGSQDRDSARTLLQALIQSEDHYASLVEMLPEADPIAVMAHLNEQQMTTETRFEDVVQPHLPSSSSKSARIVSLDSSSSKKENPSIPGWKFALAAMITLLISAPLFWWQNSTREPGPWASLNFEEAPPYPYREVRSVQLGSRQLSENAEAIKQSFLQAMEFYVRRDYEGANVAFSGFSRELAQLELDPSDSEGLCLKRDFFFYYGVSLLASSKAAELPIGISSEQLNQRAKSNLQEANSLVDDCGATPYRESFFLGLTLGAGSAQDSALSVLKQIPPNSPFFEKSQQFIDFWSK